MLNCDWFQPFDHSSYSVGVLYLVILSLPWSLRFKPENIIITGIIPGPKDNDEFVFKTDMNTLRESLWENIHWFHSY